MYTGNNWPYEALQNAKKTLQEDKAHVMLLGERNEVEDLREILTTYSFLRRYGRPFLALQHLIYSRIEPHAVFVEQRPLKSAIFTIPKDRVDLLRTMLDHTDNLVYEIVFAEEDSVRRMSNFPETPQETFVETVGEALKNLGWTEQLAKKKTTSPHWTDMESYLNAKTRKTLFPALDRWFSNLSHVWQKFKK